MITGIAGNMESMLVEQWAYRETDEHRENLFHQQSICLAVWPPYNATVYRDEQGFDRDLYWQGYLFTGIDSNLQSL